jgi:hypothetical protein
MWARPCRTCRRHECKTCPMLSLNPALGVSAPAVMDTLLSTVGRCGTKRSHNHRNYQPPPLPNQSFRIFEDGHSIGTGPTHQFEPPLFYSRFSEENLHSSTRPQLGTGCHNQNSHTSVPPNGVGPAFRQQTPFGG